MTPAPLRNIPKIKVRDEEYLEAFRTLDRSRRMGHSAPDPIQVSEVVALCKLLGIASSAVGSKYLRIIQAMDSAFHVHWSASQPQK